MKNQSHKMASVILLSLCFFYSGCATVKTAKPMTAEQQKKVKASLGHIGITNATYLPSVNMQTPAKGAMGGAGKGMAAGAAAPFKLLSDCSGDGCGYLAIFAIAMVPVTTVVGGVGGAIVAEPAQEVKGNESALNAAISKLKMQETFSSRVFSNVKELEDIKASIIEDRGPAIEGANTNYEDLTNIDTVKEVAIKSFQLKGAGSINPPMSLLITASTRLVRMPDNNEFYSKTFTCRRGKARFAEWAANAGSMLHDETEACYSDLAQQIIEDIYLLDTLAAQDDS